ncbi:MAG: hypothetical protein B6U95_09085 [Thermofilum sp. ex4484_82]|nr:MAG: hypothetical protein B6U95_09085 [Thermofilum sp. ex4484_82]OYT36002.1 MAG: hypothetical protein B6U96_09090 [Archaeoglobales archaeon ex4484_92]
MKKIIFKTDLDITLNEEWLKEWVRTRKLILKNLGFKVEDVVVKPSSKRGHHFWWHCMSEKELSDMEIVKVQFLLGDCIGRTLVNIKRVKRGYPMSRGNKLFSLVLWRKDPNEMKENFNKLLDELKEGKKLTKKERRFIVRYASNLQKIVEKYSELMKEGQEILKGG